MLVSILLSSLNDYVNANLHGSTVKEKSGAIILVHIHENLTSIRESAKKVPFFSGAGWSGVVH